MYVHVLVNQSFHNSVKSICILLAYCILKVFSIMLHFISVKQFTQKFVISIFIHNVVTVTQCYSY